THIRQLPIFFFTNTDYNLRYNHSEFPIELIPPCSIFLNHELILRYIYLSFSLQGTMMVTEYRDRFLQLARYAPAEVADDREKQEHFMEGLEDYIQYALLNLRFDDFNHLVDSALNTERKHREIEDKKRKITPVASGSNTRPRLQPIQQYQQQQQYRPPQQYQQQPQQYPLRQKQQAGQGQSFLAPPPRVAPP